MIKLWIRSIRQTELYIPFQQKAWSNWESSCLSALLGGPAFRRILTSICTHTQLMHRVYYLHYTTIPFCGRVGHYFSIFIHTIYLHFLFSNGKWNRDASAPWGLVVLGFMSLCDCSHTCESSLLFSGQLVLMKPALMTVPRKKCSSLRQQKGSWSTSTLQVHPVDCHYLNTAKPVLLLFYVLYCGSFSLLTKWSYLRKRTLQRNIYLKKRQWLCHYVFS